MISEIKAIAISADSLEPNKQEALRYLGAKESDEMLDSLYEECLVDVKKASEPRGVYIKTGITVCGDTIDFGFMQVNSKGLAKNLNGCDEVYVFCATLGIGMDRHFERIRRLSQAKATVFSAVGSAMIECFCDYVNDTLKDGTSTKPRFSCGYGDFCIEHQADILKILEAAKRLGVCLTDSYMMVPVKTVTAIIGIRR